MDALTVLTNDHLRIKALLNAVENVHDAWKKRLFDQAKSELRVHSQLEETVLDPNISQHGLENMVKKDLDDHETFQPLLKELEELPPIHPEFTRMVRLLSENVEQHVSQEEEEMFPKVREILDPCVIEVLGIQIQEARKTRQTVL
jgi:iron-sulfur cluster repair protein YtfE (RIC family)